MSHYFAFLRAINAGPGRVVRMNVLRQAFESLGFLRVATFLGSGNVVFETRAKGVRTLERKIERRLQQALGYDVPVFIRTHGAQMSISFFLPTILTRRPRPSSLGWKRTWMDSASTDVKFTGGVAGSQAHRFSRLCRWRRCSACLLRSVARTRLESWSRSGRRVSLQQ